ncbi:hypothetical protein PVAP13_5NG636701 [Panicum virgatum]|uniref:Uncharacterized protein n=1 Tax=Panicum virgatum TaxID=38727 RepID=A0A8T0SAX3_PANVG|nr:hypothetical protein PVAP13_5NG636701 [Panicum virgatum]
MALRSLLSKMKALPLPRQVLGSGACATAPKPKSWATIRAKFEDVCFRNGSVDELIRAMDPAMHKRMMKLSDDKIWRENLKGHCLVVLVSVVGFGSVGYIRARL